MQRRGVTNESDELRADVGSPSELTAAIERVTSALTKGSASGFSTDSIVVTVNAPSVPDLTIIDLPGIVRTATQGQDPRVIADVNSMVEFYLKQERTIVLAIVPSNQDVATVDILERALTVDPTGERTIGVLTKPDLIGEGAEDEVVAVLKNERKPLKLGYIMVKNRSAMQLKQGAINSPAANERAEREFFVQHPVWKTVDRNLLGVANLTAKLTKLLTKRIASVLPELKWELQEHFEETEKETEKLGDPPPAGGMERAKLVLRLFADYSSVLRHSARGDYREQILSQNPRLRLRAVADRVFRQLEQEISEQKPDFEAHDFTMKLHQELKALRGRELPGLLNSYFFYGFMARHVEMWRPLIDGAKARLYDAALDAGGDIAEEIFPAYPGCSHAVRCVLGDFLAENSETMTAKVEDVFKHESDPFISKNELSEAILKVRFERFEKALAAVMDACGSGEADAAKSAEKERNVANAKGAAGDAKLAESHADAAGAPAEAKEEALVSAADDKRRSTKDALKEHPLKEMVMTSLGRWYMANHGVTSLSMVEDMRTVLIAYWGVAAKRITENICMLFETHLLAKLGEDVEKKLLHHAQKDDGGVADELLAQDAEIERRREETRKKKTRVAGALNSLSKFAPNCVAKPREGTASKKEVVTAPTLETVSLTRSDEQVPKAEVVVLSGDEKPPLETFTFSSNGDNGGFIYWLGTSGRRDRFTNPMEKGRVRVTSSGMAQGSEALLVARKRQPCWTAATPDAWICLDLGRNRALKPTHYTLCNGSPDPGMDLTAWALEGYDATKDAWLNLHAGPVEPLPSPWGVKTYPVDSKNKAWRYLRLHLAGANSKGTMEMPVCAWEFYGQLFAA